MVIVGRFDTSYLNPESHSSSKHDMFESLSIQ